MHRVLKKDQILTIPNLLSIVRLALIPLIVWLYCVKKEYNLSVAIILLSGVTDIVDGYIARHFNMISDFGKILDPIADKLTQAAVIICLAVKYDLMYVLITLFAVKELIMGTMGFLAIKKKDTVNSAKWYGKANTVILYAVMMLLILFPGMSDVLANALIVLCGAAMLLSLILYTRFYIKLFSNKSKKQEKSC